MNQILTIVLVGDISDGIKAFGPFTSWNAAHDWIQNSGELGMENWCIMDIEAPEIDEIDEDDFIEGEIIGGDE